MLFNCYKYMCTSIHSWNSQAPHYTVTQLQPSNNLNMSTIFVTFTKGLFSARKPSSALKKQAVESAVKEYVVAERTTIDTNATEARITYVLFIQVALLLYEYHQCSFRDGFHSSASDPKSHATVSVVENSGKEVNVLHVYKDNSGKTYPGHR
jgi:hypothetical protein